MLKRDAERRVRRLVPSKVHIFEMEGSTPAAFLEAEIMASELSTPWILPFPVARVLAIWRLMIPSTQLIFSQHYIWEQDGVMIRVMKVPRSLTDRLYLMIE
jgi:hypothetical protein